MRRLSGDAASSSRSTNHSGEIAWLRLQAVTAGSRRDELGYLAAAELLQSHDETGCSLDHREPYRALVEHLLGYEILENHVRRLTLVETTPVGGCLSSLRPGLLKMPDRRPQL